ncbi:DEAD/DEAH box helicase [Acidithiobacillus ferriphilus]|jgi:ATP-dependent RNA helicase RhlE|uniref:DEAD/DEAH box helicase n=1 Tax=Acidithiobacillus ferriphilus TaxID=1689834 RepID=UPI001C07D405|nr:DEAD/DEAH box helicase [Acidithiobacillus ferriphilus]MBU2833601.1 DEAD/DEAH box helicase [Acidithiobacillus ferriphilus]MBW9247708.1 DEAD/DEAH box helicase [Acidithiobacillus ferriphilus]
MSSFESLGLSEPIWRAAAERGYTTPTPIQEQAIPVVMSGVDLLAGAQTGTGKTAAFAMPILHKLSATADTAARAPSSVRALILVPTRELAAQVEESVQLYGRYLSLRSLVLIGGVKINPQMQKLRRSVDVLVATPGRLLDHIQQRSVDLSHVEILVLDEADRMLDMGFIRDIRRILAVLPKKRQNLLFSATFSPEIRSLADGLLNNPASVEVATRNATADNVAQRVFAVDQDRKRELLAHLIEEHQWGQVLVFTRTKHGADRLAKHLSQDGMQAMAIHGDKSQGARTRALAEFKEGKVRVLVATDIAARGIDISELPHVVNFELPHVPEDYVHRIGRTGRAGNNGQAVSLVSGEERKQLQDVEKLLRRSFDREIVVGFEPRHPFSSHAPSSVSRRPPQAAGRGRPGSGAAPSGRARRTY